MVKVVSVRAVRPFVVAVTLGNAIQVEIDIVQYLNQGIFQALRDYELFALVSLDPLGGLEWPNGASIAPETVLRAVRSVPASSR